MLSFWRKQKTLAVHLVFWPIIAVFVIWGFERYGNPVGGAAAVVNGRNVSLTEYRNAVQRQVEFYNQIFQGNFDEKTQEQYHVKERALQELINAVLVGEQAEKMGLSPTDAEVRDTIVNDPYLQKDGKFSRDYYDMALRNLHMTPAQFEEEQRKMLLMQHISGLFEQHIPASSLEVQKSVDLKSQKKNLEFLRFDKDAVMANLKSSESETTTYLTAHGKEVREYFDMHQSEFSKPEEVHASHILVKATKGKADEEKAAREKIEKIKKEITSDNFAELAKKYSDDPGSKVKGGDLGWFGHGRMVPEFEKTAFTLDVGQISAPVKSDFGYHIIKVQGKHPLERADFEKVKGDIARRMLASDKFEKAMADAEKGMNSDPKGTEQKLLALLPAKSKFEETGMFSLGDENIPKLGEDPDLVVAAMTVTPEKPLYPKLVKAGGINYLIRLKKAEKATVGSKDKVAQDLATNEGRDVFSAWNMAIREHSQIQINPQLRDNMGGGAEPPPED